MIPKCLRGHSCSFRTNLVLCRYFRLLLFPKPVSWLGLFWDFRYLLDGAAALEHTSGWLDPMKSGANTNKSTSKYDNGLIVTKILQKTQVILSFCIKSIMQLREWVYFIWLKMLKRSLFFTPYLLFISLFFSRADRGSIRTSRRHRGSRGRT